MHKAACRRRSRRPIEPCFYCRKALPIRACQLAPSIDVIRGINTHNETVVRTLEEQVNGLDNDLKENDKLNAVERKIHLPNIENLYATWDVDYITCHVSSAPYAISARAQLFAILLVEILQMRDNWPMMSKQLYSLQSLGHHR